MNIGSLLREQVQRHPQKTAVIVNDVPVDFATLNSLTNSLTLRLKEAGISKGDTVAVTLPNSLELIISYFAVLRLGAVFMGLDQRLTEEELSVLFADACPKVWISGGKTTKEGWDKQLGAQTLPLAIGSTLLDLGGSTSQEIEDAPVQDEDPCVLLYTSGSTGRPKGVLLPVRTLGVFPEFCDSFYGDLLPLQVVGLSIPMCHSGGLINCNILAARGVPFVIVEPFRPDRFLLAIQKYGITGFQSVPPILMALLQAQLKMRLELKSLYWIAPFGMSISVPLMETLSQAFPGVHMTQGYGLTETTGAIVAIPFQDSVRKVGSIGKLLVPGCTLEIQGQGGEQLPRGEVGEIAIAGKCLMLGYLNRPELNAQVFRNGFFLTGDLGYQDDEGFFYHMGRKDDVINVGGEKVYPAEIEQALYRHPKVRECCVLGIDNPKRGKAVIAFVSPLPGQTPEKREILGFLKERLASFKIPQEIVFMEALPKTPLGKVAKETLLQTGLEIPLSS